MASSEKIIAGEDQIADYLPQKPPMVMIGKLISAENGRTTTSLLIREDNLFCIDKKFTEAGIIENMAQTAAAGAGYKARQENKTPAPGFIGGIRNLKIISLPVAGDEIITDIKVEHQVFDATVVTGCVYNHNELIASCEMKIFIFNQKQENND
jgi:predicted hotdog family 3-hydroxylacyl-ACP dehydratase